jgi:hypothetical protein
MTPEDFHALREGHAELKQQVSEVKTDLLANTEATKRIETNTAELMEWLRAFQGVFKVLNMVGSVAKPLGYIAAAIGAIASAWYVFIHKGTP